MKERNEAKETARYHYDKHCNTIFLKFIKIFGYYSVIIMEICASFTMQCLGTFSFAIFKLLSLLNVLFLKTNHVGHWILDAARYARTVDITASQLE